MQCNPANYTDISDEYISSIFSRRVSQAKSQQEADDKQSQFLPVYFLADSSTCEKYDHLDCTAM
jgi:hypothetical protein